MIDACLLPLRKRTNVSCKKIYVKTGHNFATSSMSSSSSKNLCPDLCHLRSPKIWKLDWAKFRLWDDAEKFPNWVRFATPESTFQMWQVKSIRQPSKLLVCQMFRCPAGLNFKISQSFAWNPIHRSLLHIKCIKKSLILYRLSSQTNQFTVTVPSRQRSLRAAAAWSRVCIWSGGFEPSAPLAYIFFLFMTLLQ